MTYSYTIETEILLNPARKRGNISGAIYLVTGTYTNSAGGTGGDINTGADSILYFEAVDEHATPAVIVVARSSGVATITVTADHSGTWLAIVKRKK